VRDQEPLPSAVDDAAEVMAYFRQGQEQNKNDKTAKPVTKTLLFLFTLLTLALTSHFMG